MKPENSERVNQDQITNACRPIMGHTVYRYMSVSLPNGEIDFRITMRNNQIYMKQKNIKKEESKSRSNCIPGQADHGGHCPQNMSI